MLGFMISEVKAEGMWVFSALLCGARPEQDRFSFQNKKIFAKDVLDLWGVKCHLIKKHVMKYMNIYLEQT